MASEAALAEPRASKTPVAWWRRPLGLLGAALRFVFVAALVGWASLAIYFNLPWASLAIALAAAFAALGIWAFWTKRRLIFAGAFLAVLAWFLTLQPSHDRPWRPEVAVMPRAFIDGDRVRLTGVRDFEYRSREDFTMRYEQREVSLAHLVAVDFFLSYWSVGPVGHTFLSFIFDNAPPLSISIETRPEVGESFDPLGSLFKQFELIYVVGSERDIVGVRTNQRNEEVYLYRTSASADDARRLLLVYLERINQLADRAEFYHLLSNSCTINIVRYARTLGAAARFNIRHYLNGWFDAYLYSMGLIDSDLPFEELRRRSRINDAAQAAVDAPDFSRRIRVSLPGMRRD